MNFILSKKENYLACVELIAKCWDARNKQLYYVSVEHYDPEHSDQQKKKFYAMMTELAFKVNESGRFKYKYTKDDLAEEFACLCPAWGTTTRVGLDGFEKTTRKSINKIGKRAMIEVIDYAFKWSSETLGIHLDAYDDHDIASGQAT